MLSSQQVLNFFCKRAKTISCFILFCLSLSISYRFVLHAKFGVSLEAKLRKTPFPCFKAKKFYASFSHLFASNKKSAYATRCVQNQIRQANHLFQVIFRHSLRRSRRTLRSAPSTADRRRQSLPSGWCGQPPPSSSGRSPGSWRGQPARSSTLGRGRNPPG